MKTWGNLVEEKYHELRDAMIQAEYDAYSNDFGSGWSFDVVLDSDGSVDVVGPRNNSCSEREWNGLAKCIYSAENRGDFGWGDAMDWLDHDDPEVSDWMKEHEVTEDDDWEWTWTDDEGWGDTHYFIGDLPDEFYLEAVKEMVNGDPSYDGYNASLDEWEKNDDELPEE